MIKTFSHRFTVTTLISLGLCFFSQSTLAATSLWEAFSEGDVYANLRLRYENVDVEGAASKAEATTLRTVLGYKTGDLYGFSALLEFENVTDLGGNYATYPGQPNKPYPLIADPDGSEVNQAYLQYQAAGNNDIRLGRQIITYRDKPFHRYIGTILWRQNWQTFDAISIQNTALTNTRLSYAYVSRVNRIFGDDAPSPLDEFDSDSHFVNVQNHSFDFANLETYAYLLDFDNAPVFSSQTYGARLSGKYPVNARFTPLYALEYAHQSDYGSYQGSYDASYQLAEVGIAIAPLLIADNVLLKASYERLSGDGTANGSFQTILGTNHAFQGTADQFLVTPADGIRDYYMTAVTQLYGFNFIASYHVLESDNMDYRYGEELDLELSRGIGKHLTLGVKYANYDADDNTLNLTRGVSADVEKFWLFAMANF